MTIQEIRERTPERIQRLTEVWEASVRATHLFLTEPEILEIKKEVPDALRSVPRLAAAKDAAGDRWPLWGRRAPCWRCCLSPRRSGERAWDGN